MKTSALLLSSAIGIAALGVSAASAAPASGVAIGETASTQQLTQNVWYGRWGWGGRYRYWGPGWRYRAWGPGYGWGYAGGPGWCYYHPYRCGRY